jgi:tetratricopeptide (TPR) repeat protein
MKSRIVFLTCFCALLIFSGCTTGVSEQEAAKVYYNLGNAYFELDQLDKAVDAYMQALELDDSLERASYNLARVYLESGYVERGIELLEQLLENDPDNSILLNTLAYAYTLNGENTEALSIYQDVLSENEYDKNALYNSGVLYWNMEEYSKAEQQFESLYSLTPENKTLLYNLGMLELDMENREKGVRYLNAYIEAGGEKIEAFNVLGDAYRQEEYYNKALSMYNHVLEKEKDRPQILFKKAFILLTAIGDNKAGMETLEEAVVAGFEDKEQLLELIGHPDLLNKDQVKAFLLEKNLLTQEDITGAQ